MTRRGIVASVTGLLWLAHVCVIAWLGTTGRGPLVSDAIQLALGAVLIYCVVAASQRSEGMALSFWRLTAVAYTLWFVAQTLAVYTDLAPSATPAWIENLLFSFWFLPLAMAMFLDPEAEGGNLDVLMALDFAQAALVCVAAYLYFFYLPKSASPGALAREVWTPYFAGYFFVAASFVVRAVLTRSRDARVLFGRLGVYLSLSGCVDAAYFYGPGMGWNTGAWFDLLWSALLVIPIGIAMSWTQLESPEILLERPVREKRIYTELSHLIYPLLVLFMSLGIARERLGLAAVVVLLSFVCSSARLLVTQHRLILVKEALRREASRDGLTSLWNRKAILSILERDLRRAERDQHPVGVIMIDVDHFKQINDTRGHAVGDTALRIIASGIAAVVRPYDSVGRCGGEEFLIVAPGCGMAETWELAERVRCHVAGCSIMVAGASVQVSLSLGVATGQSAAEIEKVLLAADAAMYQAKNAGRNRVEPVIDSEIGRTAVAAEIPVAVHHRDFWL